MDVICIDHTATQDLGNVLRKLTVYKRKTMIKIIHGGTPMHLFLHKQGRHDSPICTRFTLHAAGRNQGSYISLSLCNGQLYATNVPYEGYGYPQERRHTS